MEPPFSLTPRCLRAPPRGGRRWNVTRAINNQIREESDHLPTYHTQMGQTEQKVAN